VKKNPKEERMEALTTQGHLNPVPLILFVWTKIPQNDLCLSTSLPHHGRLALINNNFLCYLHYKRGVASHHHNTNKSGNNYAQCRWNHDLCEASCDKHIIQDSLETLIRVRSEKNDDDVVEGGGRFEKLEIGIPHGIKDEQGERRTRISPYFQNGVLGERTIFVHMNKIGGAKLKCSTQGTQKHGIKKEQKYDRVSHHNVAVAQWVMPKPQRV